VAHPGKFAAREIHQTLQKKSIFVLIKYSGMPAQRGIRIINNVIATNCLIHQQNLYSQVLSMNHVMQVVIKAANYIRSHALLYRQFKILKI
jgi:hypothetical protein